MSDLSPDVNRPEPFTLADLTEKRRYVESRSTRDHWGAAELAHVDEMARWIATVDRLCDQHRRVEGECVSNTPERPADDPCLCDYSGYAIETVDPQCPIHGTAELCGAEHYYVKGLRCMKRPGHEGTHQNGVVWR